MNALVILIVCAVLAGCSAPRHSEPLTGAVQRTNAQVARGQLVFSKNCDYCHDGGRGGLGPSFLPVPDFMIRTQVRAGLGRMPAFSKERLPDDQLDDLIAYLDAIRSRAKVSQR